MYHVVHHSMAPSRRDRYVGRLSDHDTDQANKAIPDLGDNETDSLIRDQAKNVIPLANSPRWRLEYLRKVLSVQHIPLIEQGTKIIVV